MIKVSLLIVFLSFLPAVIYFGQHIPYEDQSSIFDTLRDTAAIIFAILGAWIAIIYPKDLKAIFKLNDSASTQATEVFEKLISSLIIVTFTLITMIFLMPLIALVKNIEFFQQYKMYLRSGLFLYIYVLTWTQIYALLSTLIPNIKMLIDLAKAKSKAKVLGRHAPMSERNNSNQ